MTIESIEDIEKGKSGLNPEKMKWDYKLRNIILVALSLIFFVNVLLFFDSQVYFDFILNYSLSVVPFNFLFTAFFSSGFFSSLIMYPLILYWERKHLMTIYLMQEKSTKLRPVAIPDKVLQYLEKKQFEA